MSRCRSMNVAAELSHWFPQLNRIPLREVHANKPTALVAFLVKLN
jgi:hypothetical protein